MSLSPTTTLTSIRATDVTSILSEMGVSARSTTPSSLALTFFIPTTATSQSSAASSTFVRVIMDGEDADGASSASTDAVDTATPRHGAAALDGAAKAAIGVGVALGLLLALSVLGCWFWRRRRQREIRALEPRPGSKGGEVEMLDTD